MKHDAPDFDVYAENQQQRENLRELVNELAHLAKREGELESQIYALRGMCERLRAKVQASATTQTERRFIAACESMMNEHGEIVFDGALLAMIHQAIKERSLASVNRSWANSGGVVGTEC
jgi:predicted  nucleic acid-binding Zn-ribbon protein